MSKGISPLIASILLIGFTIAIAALVTYWYMGSVKEQIEKRGAVDAIKSACAIEIDFKVEEVCKNSDSIQITAKNEKDKMINGVKVSLLSDSESEVHTLNEYFEGLREKVFSITPKKLSIGDIKKAKIMPMLVRDGYTGTCGDKIVEFDVNDCS